MTAFVSIADIVKTQGTKLTTTNATDVYTAPTNNDITIVNINVAEVSGNADTITLQWEDGSGGTVYDLWTLKAIPANTSLEYTLAFALKRGSDVKATAGTANRLHVTVTAFSEVGRIS